MSKKFRTQMQRRPSEKQIIQMVRDVYEVPQPEPARRLNQYTCRTCGGVITTVDRDEGVTPMMLACRATEGCNGSMFSAMYRVDPNLTPDWEWYKPAKLPKGDMHDYVEAGGLLIRKIE